MDNTPMICYHVENSQAASVKLRVPQKPGYIFAVTELIVQQQTAPSADGKYVDVSITTQAGESYLYSNPNVIAAYRQEAKLAGAAYWEMFEFMRRVKTYREIWDQYIWLYVATDEQQDFEIRVMGKWVKATKIEELRKGTSYT